MSWRVRLGEVVGVSVGSVFAAAVSGSLLCGAFTGVACAVVACWMRRSAAMEENAWDLELQVLSCLAVAGRGLYVAGGPAPERCRPLQLRVYLTAFYQIEPSFGALYAALERLEQQRFIETQHVPGGPERGYRRALECWLTEAGSAQLVRNGWCEPVARGTLPNQSLPVEAV